MTRPTFKGYRLLVLPLGNLFRIAAVRVWGAILTERDALPVNFDVSLPASLVMAIAQDVLRH